MANDHEDGFTKGLIFIRTPQDLRPKMFQCGGRDDVHGVKRLTTARHIGFGLHVRSVECVLKAAWMMLKDTSGTAGFQGWIDNIIDPAGSPTWTQVSATEERHVWEENVGTVAPPAISKTLSQSELLDFVGCIAAEFNSGRLTYSLVIGRIVGQSKPILVRRQSGDTGKDTVNVPILSYLSCRSAGPFSKC